MSFRAKRHKLCHLAFDHVLKPGTADADFCVFADISDLGISAAALALSMQKPKTKKDAASTIYRRWTSQRGLVGEAEACPMSLELHKLMSSERQMKLSGNSGEWPPSHTALLVCICLLDWESTNVLFPPSFQRADQGPGAEP